MDRATKNKIIKVLLIAFGIVVALSLLSLAGRWDAEAAEMSERHYCERVATNVHTHYNKRINCE